MGLGLTRLLLLFKPDCHITCGHEVNTHHDNSCFNSSFNRIVLEKCSTLPPSLIINYQLVSAQEGGDVDVGQVPRA